MKVVILSGIPGSGKTTYIKSLDLTANVAVCSADAHFTRNGVYTFKPAEIGKAHGECLKKFVETLDANIFDVLVVDNTNTTPIECAPYIALAMAYGVAIEIVQFNCPAEIGFMRTVHGVPLKSCYHYRDNLNNFERDMPPFWKHVVTFTKVNTPHTASDIAKARVLARQEWDKDPSIQFASATAVRPD